MHGFYFYICVCIYIWVTYREDGVADAAPDVIEMFGLRWSPWWSHGWFLFKVHDLYRMDWKPLLRERDRENKKRYVESGLLLFYELGRLVYIEMFKRSETVRGIERVKDGSSVYLLSKKKNDQFFLDCNNK